MKQKTKDWLYVGFTIVIVLLTVNRLVTGFIYNYQHPEKTRMEVLLHTPKHFFWDFE